MAGRRKTGELMLEQMVVLNEKINSHHAVDLAAALTHQVILKRLAALSAKLPI